MIKELYDQMQKLVADMRAITDRLGAEDRSWTEEERQEYQRMEAEFDALEQRAATEQNLERRAGAVERFGDTSTGRPAPEHSRETARGDGYQQAFRSYLRTGRAMPELRALQADSDAAGGYVAPQAFYNEIIKQLNNLVRLRAACTQIRLGVGASLGAPTLSADPADADWTAEITSVSEDSTMAFGKRELRPHPLTKYIKVSQKLIRSAAIDIEGFVAQRLAYKMAVPIENAICNGTGTNQPLGIFVASASGISTSRDTTCASTTAFTADELFDVIGSVREQYLAGCSWIVHRDFVTKARKLKDGSGAYLWQPAMSAADPATIGGYPVIRSEYAPNTFTAGLYIAVFGDMRQGYWWVDGAEMSIQTIDQLYTMNNQIAYKAYAEADGAPVDEYAFGRLILHT